MEGQRPDPGAVRESDAAAAERVVDLEPAPRPAPEKPAPEKSVPKKPPAAKPAGPRRVAVSSTADAWIAVLESLKQRSPSLAEILERRGKPVELGERAVVQLSNLREDERLMAFEPRNQRAVGKAFETVLQRTIEVVLQDSSDGRRGKEDPYTQHVADLFGGRIEDET